MVGDVPLWHAMEEGPALAAAQQSVHPRQHICLRLMPRLCRTQHPDSSWHAAAGEGCLFTQVQQLRDDSASDEQVVLAMAEVLGPWPMTDSYVDQVSNYLQPFSLHMQPCMGTHTPMHVRQGSAVCFLCKLYLCLAASWPTNGVLPYTPCGSSQQAPAFGWKPQGVTGPVLMQMLLLLAYTC